MTRALPWEMQEDGTPAKCQSMGNGFDAVPRSYFYSFNNHDAILHRGIFMPIFTKRIQGFKEDDMELKDTVKGMMSDDCKERMAAEYHQTKIRYEKLKKLNTRISRQK